MNLNWPHTPENNLFPWYKVIWHLIWLPLILLGALIMLIGLTPIEGPREAWRLMKSL